MTEKTHSTKGILKTFNVCFFSLTSLGLVSVSQSVMAQALSNALDFNALIFNDLSVLSGDTEGRLAVGGNFIIENGRYSVSGCSSPDCVILVPPAGSQPQSNGQRDDLVVGGDITNLSQTDTAAWEQTSGNAVVGGTVGPGVNITFGGGNTLNQNVGSSNVGVNFANQQTALIQDSVAFSTFTSNGSIIENDPNFLTLSGSDPILNVFNISASEWGGGSKTRTIDVPQGSQVLINVSGQTIDVSGGEFNFGTQGCRPPIFATQNPCLDPTDFAPGTLVNFPEARNINYAALEHQGAFLAPRAEFQADGGAINGQSVLASARTGNGFEFHYRADNGRPFNPNPGQPIPEPLTILGTGLVAGFLPLLKRKKLSGKV